MGYFKLLQRYSLGQSQHQYYYDSNKRSKKRLLDSLPFTKIQINNSLSKIVFQKIIHNNYIHFNHIYYNLNVIFCLRVLLLHLKKIYTNFSRSSKKSLSEHLDLNHAWLARVSLHHLKAVFGVVFRWLWWSWSWR